MKNSVCIILLLLFNCSFGFQHSDTLKQQPIKWGCLLSLNTSDGEKKLNGFTAGIGAEKLFYSNFFYKINLLSSLFPVNEKSSHKNEISSLELPLFLGYKPFNKNIAPTLSTGFSTKLFKDNYNFYPLKFSADIAMEIEIKFKFLSIAPGIRYSYNKQNSLYYFLISCKS